MHNINIHTARDSKDLDSGPYNKNPWEGMSQEDMVYDAGEFMMQYIQSEKYRELLLKEIELNNNTILIDKKDNMRNLSNELPFQGTSEDIANQIIEQRIDSIKYTIIKRVNNSGEKRKYVGQTEYDDSLSKDKGGWKVGKHHITFEESLFSNQSDQDTAVHEFTHVSTRGNHHIIPLTLIRLHESANTNDAYYNKPTEIHARITAVKYMLWKTGICNPLIDDITEEHIYELMKYDFMKDGYDEDMDNALLDLLRDAGINKKELVKLMNEIALNNNNGQSMKNIGDV